MRFQKMFRRQKGSASTDPALGSDGVPSALQDQQASCALACRANNTNGWPVQRFAVGYAYAGTGTARDLTAQLFVWDDTSEAWYAIGDAKTMKPGQVVWFDQPTLADFPQTSSAGQLGGTGAIEVYLKVNDATPAPNGVYTFILGPDVSNTV